MEVTVQDIINHLTTSLGHIENTVDTLKSGLPSSQVTGIAVSFMPTYNTIHKAIELGANLLITHEGLFYSHWDQTDFGKNEVIDQKKKLIKDSGIAIFRFHDYWHRYQPDGIMLGLVTNLGWDDYVVEHQPAATIISLPGMTAKEVADHLKNKLHIKYVRFMGNPEKQVKRVGILVGYRGSGSTAIPFFENHDLDLVIYGEGPEWETPEYVRDSISQGKEKALLVIGHAESEEPGMSYLADKLQQMFQEIPVYFIPNESCFEMM
ncbi:Nif3-like dinuclear metal center hexameric protein [Bacillus timonensis]|uniref:Nif3-like dinuclear metal center hexameric protein n=1 Tax=Bacillus timonensis TaxID=1033734 RepID=UPI0002886397|nr:Nif3-like dinuclear metal center hexameric protein [Bacillus timonensis]